MMNNQDTSAQDTNVASTSADVAKSNEIKIDGEDLKKALDAASQLIHSGAIGREQALLQKSLQGQATAEEKAELAKLLAGERDDSIAKSVMTPLDPRANETFAKSIDASEYISGLHSALVTSFGEVAKALQSSDESREREVVVLAKALVEIGKMVAASAKLTKSLEQRLDAWGKQPARGPRSQTPAPIAKGLAERTGEGAAAIQSQEPRVSRIDILNGLLSLAETRGVGEFAKSGESYGEAVAKFESTNEIHPALLQEVMQLLGRKGALA